MTARVRFASGLCLQYNGASFVHRSTTYTDLYTKRDGDWIAQVPNECLIEWVYPCSVTLTHDFETQKQVTRRVNDKIAEIRCRQARSKRKRAKAANGKR